jgi:hypothetical protein
MTKKSEAPSEPSAEAETLDERSPEVPEAPAAAAEQAPSSAREKDEDRADSLSRAVSEFDRARLELSQLLGRELEEPGDAAAGAGAPAREAPKSATPPPSAADKATRSSEAERAQARPLKKGDDGCVNVCRAFESLARSAAAVCRLDDGERCRKANAVVTVAESDAGVKACACKK